MKCDKCGMPVMPKDCAVTLELGLGDEANPTAEIAKRMGISRHILPIVFDGEELCPGSPSRAQYLEGQPRCVRSSNYSHPYVPAWEPLYRETYAKMQAEEGHSFTVGS